MINDDAVEKGGAAAIALSSVRLFHERGIPVTFVSGSDAVDQNLQASGIAVSVLGGQHLLEGKAVSAAVRGIFDPTTSATLQRWIDTYDTPGTVYHLHNWHKVLSPSVFRVLRRVAGRLVMSAHDYFLACPNGGYFLYPQQRECALVPNGARCILTACDRRHYGHKLWRVGRHELRHRLFNLTRSDALVLAVHEAMVPLLALGTIAESNIRVVRNPVTPWRSKRVTAERNREVFFVGRLDDDKGPDLLARAARRAGVRLRLIGDGPLAAQIARDNPDAELLGWRNRDEIATLVADARIVVSPSRWRETFGLVALEALTSGIPVIVSQFSSIAGEIVERGLGFACNPYDEEALAAAIDTLARDDKRVADISQRAFSEARHLAPTPAQWCDELLAVYADRLRDADTARQRLKPTTPLSREGRGDIASGTDLD
ncbi:MAG TPA: glycosyltransferase family 4 protein [Stellaceae bacterium]|nr:glycosyltransferase family 4 protein [Stellaceae bacterium]